MKNKTVLIIGGGPAGASAALGLLRAGFDTIVYEQRTHWTGRVCGSFLSSEALIHLNWLGLTDELKKSHCVPVNHCRVTTGFGKESQIDLHQQGESGYAVPREVLENFLMKSVQDKGGTVKFGARVLSIQKRASTVPVQVRYKLNGTRSQVQLDNGYALVMADGRFTLTEPQNKFIRSGWYGWNARFKGISKPPGSLSLHFFKGGYVGLLTFADQTTNVSGLIYFKNKTVLSWEKILETCQREQPFLRIIMKSAERVSSWTGVGPLPYAPSLRIKKDVFPVGDAAAVGDPFLGEGVGRALGAGPMLYKSFSQDTSIKNVHDQYKRLWSQAYQKRLTFGFFARILIKSPVLFRPGLSFMVGNRKISQFITDTLHPGFSSK